MRQRLVRTAAAAIALALSAAGPARAATFRVDDSGTTLSSPTMSMRWRSPVPGKLGDHLAEAETQVFLRLNLQPWLQRRARLYLGLARTDDPILATWRTQGRLLPGTVLSGQRALLFDGVLTSELQQETLRLDLQADGRQLTRDQQLLFYVEIDVLP